MSDNVNGVDGVRVLSAAEAAAAPLPRAKRAGAGRPSVRLGLIRGLEVGGRVEFAVPEGGDRLSFRNSISSSVMRKGALPFRVSVRTNDNVICVTRLADEVAAPAETPTDPVETPVTDNVESAG